MEDIKPELFQFDAIGCHWEIETDEGLAPAIRHLIAERIELFDLTYSRFRPDSLVSRIANAPNGGHFSFPEDALPLFGFYDQLYELSHGSVDPLVGRRLESLGYDATYSLIPVPGIHYERYDWSKDVLREGTFIESIRPVVIDVGAAGKGYLIDIVSALLLSEGVKDFVIDAGGDIRHFGESGVRIGLEDPENPGRVLGVVNLKNGAICASATNRRSWGDDLHHIIDARTGMPVSKVIATWVLAPDAMAADGLATGLFFQQADAYAEHFSFSSLRMYNNKTVEMTANFTGEIFYNQ